ncbi:ionotropic receptor 75a-like [Anastrepha ludens]|uniref:ionotropic receptor 75a-like n=1 Tax=Anastrepha ludens TaxID=28586 RepID=UPI0023B07185|nr:ionotropic receptor 75a-like [Anastrepha ludens]
MQPVLFSFILNHFLNANINVVVFFNCWSVQAQRHLSHLTSQRLWYTRFVNIESIDLSVDFEYQYLLHNRKILGAFLDVNCNKSEEVMNTLSRWHLYKEHYNWLLYDRSADMHKLRRLFTNANLSVDAQLTYATLRSQLHDTPPHTNLSFYTTYDVYNNGRLLGGKLNVTIDREYQCNWKVCHVSRYLSELHLRHKYGNRDKLHDITMRVSTVITNRPLSWPVPLLLAYLSSENNTEIDPISRFGYQVLLVFKDSFGCNMNLTFYDRWSTNETHGGTVGDIVTQAADFISTPVLATASRLKHLSLIAETGAFRSLCLFRTPRSGSMRGDAFLQPFNSSVWLVFSILLAILAIFLWRAFAVEMRNFRRRLPYEPSLLATFLLAFGSACYQGSNIVPFSMGGRMAYFTLYFATFIMYNYYTSILLSTLLGTPVKSDIRTLGQLADSSLEVGLQPLPYTYVYLNASQLPEVRRFVHRKIEAKRHPGNVWMPMEEGVLRVRDEPGFVFVLETSQAYSFLERNFLPHEICDLNEVMLRPDKSLYTQLHQNSTYKELTRLRAVRIIETGVWRKHRRHWAKDKLNCVPSNYLFAVGMEYTAPLFLMLLFSFVLCLLLLGVELLTERLLEHRCRHVTKIWRSILAEDVMSN